MPTDLDLSDLISTQEAAALLGVNPLTVRRWIAAGRIPGYYLGPRKTRVFSSDIVRLLAPIPAAVGR